MFPLVLFVCLVLFVFSCVMAVDGTCWSSTESLLILSFATYSHQEVCVYAVIKEFVKMQRTPQCVERPGGSQEAWDGKKHGLAGTLGTVTGCTFVSTDWMRWCILLAMRFVQSSCFVLIVDAVCCCLVSLCFFYFH